AFDAAYKLAPASLARLHCGDMFLREKHWDEARALYEAATKETNILVTNERLRYGILLSFLGAKNDEAARAALDKMTFPTESPAYYYAQAAWSFAHDANGDGEKWMRRAEAVFPVKSTAWFVRPLFDLGWVKTKPPLIAD
ncbi:MAG: hypothetical protein M3Z22_03675, partial [Verrucomicrobiota bacterium]|nr:hypothetical protein [Verrucomicrobiota bacterium]